MPLPQKRKWTYDSCSIPTLPVIRSFFKYSHVRPFLYLPLSPFLNTSLAQAENFRRKVRIDAIQTAEMKGFFSRDWQMLSTFELEVSPQLAAQAALEGRNADGTFAKRIQRFQKPSQKNAD